MEDVKLISVATTSHCFQGDWISRAPGHEPFKKKTKKKTRKERDKMSRAQRGRARVTECDF